MNDDVLSVVDANDIFQRKLKDKSIIDFERPIFRWNVKAILK